MLLHLELALNVSSEPGCTFSDAQDKASFAVPNKLNRIRDRILNSLINLFSRPHSIGPLPLEA